MKKGKLYLIDGSSLIYRAYHAIPPLTTVTGQPTNAIYGFTTMMVKLLEEEKPGYIAVAMDARRPTWRNRVYHDYKATRPPMPADLVQQLPYFTRIIEALGIGVLQCDDYEADDVIATYTRRAVESGYEVVVVSGDKDLMSLVGDGVVMVDTMKEKTYGIDEVEERHGASGERLLDLLALAGDKSDNVPGVPGIGPKSALALLQQFGSLENLLASVDDIGRPGWRQKIVEHADLARISRTLVTLADDVPLSIPMMDLVRREPDYAQLQDLFQELEFYRLAKKIAPRKAITTTGYQLILAKEQLENFCRQLKEQDGFAIDTETTSPDPMAATLVGISVSWTDDAAHYIPVGHRSDVAPQQVSLGDVVACLGPLLANPQIEKWGHNIKYDMIVLARSGLPLAGNVFDTMIASYVINPSRHRHSLSAIAQELLHHTPTEFKDLVGSGKRAKTFDAVALPQARDYACEDARLTSLLHQELAEKLVQEGLDDLFHELEMPLMPVLMRMEMAGVKLDIALLQELSADYRDKLAMMEEDIYALAGRSFNISSPKQLAVVLFDQLNLPVLKKTKTGASTDVDVLTDLAQHHPLPEKILSYRSLAKLRSTYLEALPKLVNATTGRVHTSYNQTVTATGRLSSSDPNLQNIPIRGQEGGNIRRAFVGERGNLIMSADYSQIELRILAHLSGDRELVAAFERGEDIHGLTAAKIFGVLPLMVTPDMRREAKVVNFGVLYGMSAFGLAKELRIDRGTAKAYIENYFATYGQVKKYFDRLVAEAEQQGYVTTMFGRRRYLPEIISRNPNRREMARRMAVNSPIQGSAADLIKQAMITIDRRLVAEGWQSTMIMQVHDELVFEVFPAELEALREMVRKEMTEVAALRVPLLVDIGVGNNWLEAH
ncbi:MAG: DNA polymerase I [Deltaproteobacteria bacterium]|nr:DNA polymerase I [Candidatus Anaeroferrophillus wilburensis]MBN2888667.1 DNA polymerase I [Deltaproteobacteria bacterium]